MSVIKVTLGPDETELLGRLAGSPAGWLHLHPPNGERIDVVAARNLSAVGFASHVGRGLLISAEGRAAWDRRTVEGDR